MPEKKASVRVKKGSPELTPNPPENLMLSPQLSPNPGTNQFRIQYDASTLPGGAPAVSGYDIFLNGVYNKTVTGLSPTITGLNPSTPYQVQVAGVNGAGRGELSAVFNVTTLSAAIAPPVPTGLSSPSKTDNSINLAWNTVTYSPTAGYRIYVNGETIPSLTIAAGAPPSAVLANLDPATQYSIQIASFSGTLESALSSAITITTTGTATTVVMRTDDVLNHWGINAKVTYSGGTYDKDTPANAARVINASQFIGARIYRQEFAESGSNKTAQMNYMKALYANQGTKYHVTLGSMRNKNGFNVPAMTAEQLRVHAATEIRTALDVMVSDWKPDVDLANGGDLAKVIHSIGGPNEFEEASETGSNWPRNIRIWMEQIFKGMRQGRFWNTTTQAFEPTRQGSGSGAGAADFRTIFANIPVAGPSGRTDLTAATATTAAGPIINTATGDREMSQWIELANSHGYQKGQSPTIGIQETIDAYRPMIKAPGHPTIPYILSEGGYNHMGWGLDGVDEAPSSNFAGNTKIPPWAVATYVPRAVADYAKKGMPYVKHELFDDSHNAGWNIQAYFGMVWTPSNNESNFVNMADLYAMRRFSNLLKDRSNVKNPATHSTSAPFFSINNPTGSNLQSLITQKADGSFWVLLWRNVNVFKAVDGGNTGTAINVPEINVTITFTHTSGTKVIDMWTPNKANWQYQGANQAGLTANQKASTLSIGHDTTTAWNTIPAGETNWSVAFNASPKSIQVPVGPNLQILRIV